ncbi:14515_t:CDS:2 [Entrophospora sp. SA101]|nr:14515_t:CDS:2 [Entrophospora sp. SA101]
MCGCNYSELALKIEKFSPMAGLFYGKYIIMTEQDPNGSHIKCLTVNFIDHSLLFIVGETSVFYKQQEEKQQSSLDLHYLYRNSLYLLTIFNGIIRNIKFLEDYHQDVVMMNNNILIATDKRKSSQGSDNSIKLEKLLRIVITNCDRVNTDKDLKFSKGNDVLLFPDNILIYNVNPKNALEFFKKFLLPSPSSTPQPPPSLSNQEQNIYSSTNFQVDPIPYKAVIVICSHRRRDKRCGITGPILKNEFDRILKDRGLDVENKKNEGVAVFLSSHKYAGNVIVYRDGQGIWYGHVIPCHVENIIESTVIEGKAEG